MTSSAAWKSAIRDIMSRADIVSLLSAAGVSLKKNGLGYVGLCPWHDDKQTLSLHVFPDGHVFCFGACGKPYDSADAWQLSNGGTFGDAIKALSRITGVDLPAMTKEQMVQEEHHRQTTKALGDLLALARGHLAGKEGADARAYLHSRGLADATIENAQLGFWPTGQSSKVIAGEGKAYSTDQLREIGFRATSQKKGTDYDVFFGCIIFPVFWHSELAYMTGRSVPVDDQTEKRHVKLAGDAQSVPLYGLATIDRHSKIIIVCEGEIDTLTLQQAGLPAVGLMGASSKLDDAAVELLARKPDRIILMLDDDAAGEKATHRLAHLLGSRARVARPTYPTGCKDPNDYQRRCVGECKDSTKASELLAAFIQPFVDAAPPYLDWMLSAIEAEPDLAVRGERVKDELIPYLAEIDEVVRSGMVAKISILHGSWLKRATIDRSVRDYIKAHTPAQDAPTTAMSGDASGGLVSQLVGDGAPFQPLYLERSKGDGTVVTLYSRRHGTPVPLCLAAPRQVTAAIAPDLGNVAAWVQKRAPGVDARSVPSAIVGMLEQIASTLRPRWDMAEVAEGIHDLRSADGKNTVALVDSAFRAIRKDGVWVQVDSPIIDDRYLMLSRQRIHGWVPHGWTVETLNKPLKYTPEQAFDIVVGLVNTGWRFRDHDTGADTFIAAMLPFALTWSQLWPAKPLIHITAASSSGKSMLVQGLYAGKDGRIIGGLMPTAYYNPDPSMAGLISAFSGSSRTIVLDEFESSENKHGGGRMNDILRMMRTASTGQSARLRGTQDLGAREDNLSVACISASIEPIGSQDADRNRWYVMELHKFEEGSQRLGPEITVPKYIEENHVNMDELRRTILLGLADKTAELRQAYHDIAHDPKLPGRGIIDDRWMSNTWPCLAVAKVMGLDWRVMAEIIVTAKRGEYEAIQSEKKGNRLLRALLHAPFEIPEGIGGYQTKTQTTLSTLMESRDSLDLPWLGIVLETKGAGHSLWVNWETACRGPLLRKTDFENASPRSFNSIAKDSSWHKENAVLKRRKSGDKASDGKRQVGRYTLFEWQEGVL